MHCARVSSGQSRIQSRKLGSSCARAGCSQSSFAGARMQSKRAQSSPVQSSPTTATARLERIMSALTSLARSRASQATSQPLGAHLVGYLLAVGLSLGTLTMRAASRAIAVCHHHHQQPPPPPAIADLLRYGTESAIFRLRLSTPDAAGCCISLAFFSSLAKRRFSISSPSAGFHLPLNLAASSLAPTLVVLRLAADEESNSNHNCNCNYNIASIYANTPARTIPFFRPNKIEIEEQKWRFKLLSCFVQVLLNKLDDDDDDDDQRRTDGGTNGRAATTLKTFLVPSYSTWLTGWLAGCNL